MPEGRFRVIRVDFAMSDLSSAIVAITSMRSPSASKSMRKKFVSWDRKRTTAHARRRLKRKIGYVWSAQFCTEVAHPKRFELLCHLCLGPADLRRLIDNVAASDP